MNEWAHEGDAHDDIVNALDTIRSATIMPEHELERMLRIRWERRLGRCMTQLDGLRLRQKNWQYAREWFE
jgi:hypothetical protein